MTLKLGFTGTQAEKFITKERLAKLLDVLREHWEEGAELHHGDCVGADYACHLLAKSLNYRIVIHPPIVRTKRAFCTPDVIMPADEFLSRNRKIVASIDHLIALPKTKDEELRSGTWATIRYARKALKPVTLVI